MLLQCSSPIADSGLASLVFFFSFFRQTKTFNLARLGCAWQWWWLAWNCCFINLLVPLTWGILCRCDLQCSWLSSNIHTNAWISLALRFSISYEPSSFTKSYKLTLISLHLLCSLWVWWASLILDYFWSNVILARIELIKKVDCIVLNAFIGHRLCWDFLTCDC